MAWTGPAVGYAGELAVDVADSCSAFGIAHAAGAPGGAHLLPMKKTIQTYVADTFSYSTGH